MERVLRAEPPDGEVNHTVYYQFYELNHAALSPLRAAADVTRLYFKNPLNPLAHTSIGRNMAAACEVFERSTRRYGKPEFGITSTVVRGVRVPVAERVVWTRPFGRLIHFERTLPDASRRDPRLLIVAPMSGHYATLLRGTVEAMLPRHDVYVTDWEDARMVPLAEGRFDLDDYIDYLISMFHFLGEDTHVVAVCQPAVPVFAAVALMEEAGDPYAPSSMTLMGGPIDTRESPTEVNRHAGDHGLDWFRRNVITTVPWPHPGFGREVYPGFLQLGGFMSMNLDRHLIAHKEFYSHLVQGDGDSATKHREFYDEYMAVMDLTAEFFLQTVDTVFIRHALPNGKMTHRGRPIRPEAIRNTALLTVEGEKDDISGLGQTAAAHRLAVNLPDDKRYHYEQPGVGHYGVFNGSRFRSEIAPRIADFVWTHNRAPRPNAGRVRPAATAKGTTPAEAAVAPATAAAPVPATPAVKPEMAQPKAAKVAVAKPMMAKPEAAKPKSAKPTSAKPKVAEAKSAGRKETTSKPSKPKSAVAKPKAEASGAKATATTSAIKPAGKLAAKPAVAVVTAMKPSSETAATPAVAEPVTPEAAVLASPPTAGEPAAKPSTTAAGSSTAAKPSANKAEAGKGRAPRKAAAPSKAPSAPAASDAVGTPEPAGKASPRASRAAAARIGRRASAATSARRPRHPKA